MDSTSHKESSVQLESGDKQILDDITIQNIKAKHLKNWYNSRSVVSVMQNTKAYHMHLTVLSDQKANIVIAASSIIISVCFSQLSRFDGLLLYALLVITVFTTCALLFAILSVAPVFNKAQTKMDLSSSGFNPLFFGHYTDVAIEDYTKHMKQTLMDQEKLYDTMILDLYQMGDVLKNQKFKYLTWSYRIFFLGILIGLVMFLSALLIG